MYERKSYEKGWLIAAIFGGTVSLVGGTIGISYAVYNGLNHLYESNSEKLLEEDDEDEYISEKDSQHHSSLKDLLRQKEEALARLHNNDSYLRNSTVISEIDEDTIHFQFDVLLGDGCGTANYILKCVPNGDGSFSVDGMTGIDTVYPEESKFSKYHCTVSFNANSTINQLTISDLTVDSETIPFGNWIVRSES